MINWSPGVTLEAVEKQVILAALDHFRWNKTTTANALGISIRTLDARIEKYDEERKELVRRQEAERQGRESFLARQRGPQPEVPKPAAMPVQVQATRAPAPVVELSSAPVVVTRKARG